MNKMKTSAKYRRCLVLAGGGFRFGYYLGVHAAAEAKGFRPDILLATCGGALAAAVIARLPDARSRRDWIAGPTMYKFLCEIAPTRKASPWPAFGAAAQRWLAHTRARYIPDLFDDYLFEFPAALALPPQSASTLETPTVAIVGTRLLFGPRDAGQRRGTRSLFAEVVFCPGRAAALLDAMPAPAADPRWSSDAVAPLLETDSAMPLAEAVRISIADMFYFRSHAPAGCHYSGGVIDLFPIELARRLAQGVAMERKAPFDRWLALPALRTVFGINGNARLHHVHSQHADAWVDTRDVSKVLRAQGVSKLIDWRRNRICLAVPSTHADYVAHVDAQWEYGYRCGLAAFSSETAATRPHRGVLS